MRYRVLGSLEVRVDDRWRSLSPTKWRVLLAVLLCSANHVVPSDRLLTELWGEELPRSAHKLLQGYISQLRRSLGDGAASILTTHKWGYQVHGYQLQVQLEETDAQRFEQLFDRGRIALADGAFASALARLDEALGLWHGAPYMDVPRTPTVEAEIMRLEELRLQAMESRIELQMRCGEEDAALAALEALVLEHPMRERVSGQLMRALYRAGRQADALLAYRRLRKTLVEELGVEPSGPIQQLHQQILTADAALLTDGAGEDRPQIAGGTPRVALLQAPPGSVALTGRDRELSELLDRFRQAGQAPASTVVIDGMPGVGKSALAIEAAHRLASRFPDGQLFLDLQGSTPGVAPSTPSAALHRLLRLLDQREQAVPVMPEETSMVLRSRLAHLRLLLILDNVYDSDQVLPILSAGVGCAILITSRGILATLDGATHMHLNVLSEDEAVALLAQLAGPDRISAEPDASRMIARLCGGLPLALRIAGARLVARPGWSLRVFAERLADRRTRLDQLQVGKLAVRASFEVSYRALEGSDDPIDRMAASAFQVLGLLDEPSISVPVVATLLAQRSELVEASLERLIDVRLAEEAGPGRYQLRGLLRLFAWEKAGSQRPLKISELADGQAAIDLIHAARSVRGIRPW
ncbi:MAG TPA: BTAD domain-containing putative transcriptional regulator [Streptosporangiaceae bacterium]